MGCDTTYNASWVPRTIWIAPECHQTTHLLFCRVASECPRNGRKSCSYVRSKSWKSLIYHPMSPRGIPRHSVYGSRGRLKPWIIAFNFDCYRAPPGPVIFFAENLPMGAARLKMHLGCFATYEFPHNATKHTNLWFCGAATEWPRNGRKRCSYVRSKSWESLIYHLMSPQGIPQHSVHMSRGCLKPWLIGFNFDSFRAHVDYVIFSPKTFL